MRVNVFFTTTTPSKATTSESVQEVKVGLLFSMPHFAFDGKNSLRIFKVFFLLPLMNR